MGVLGQHAARVERLGRLVGLDPLRRSPRPRGPRPARRFSTSKVIVSPSATAAIAPPLTASGATWPAMKPCVAPEKRPSVSSATESPRPSPWIAAVTASISRMPGPPAGPSLRMTTTSPSFRPPALTASNASASPSNTRAGPLCGAAAVAGELDHAAVGGQVAAQDGEAAVGRQRVVQRAHDVLVGRLGRRLGLLADGLAGHGHACRGWSEPSSFSRAATSGTPPARHRSGAT